MNFIVRYNWVIKTKNILELYLLTIIMLFYLNQIAKKLKNLKVTKI